jgi:protein MpaA
MTPSRSRSVRRYGLAAGALLASSFAGCSSDDTSGDGPSPAPETTVEPAIAGATDTLEVAPASSQPTASQPTASRPTASRPTASRPTTDAPPTAPVTTSATDASPPTVPASTTTLATDPASSTTTLPGHGGEQIVLGESVQGRPITVVRRGEPGGAVVLVVGVIHGDEPAGAAIVDELLRAAVPDDVELWLVRSMNPDGQEAGIRHNVNGVDLNRNFPENWGPIAAPGDWQYAGPSAASEPETQAMLRLAELISPDLTLWYHQDLFRISPASGREGEVRARYAERTGLPLVEVTGGTYTGTASTWSRSIADADGVGFTVELGESLPLEGAQRHAIAVLDVATML